LLAPVQKALAADEIRVDGTGRGSRVEAGLGDLCFKAQMIVKLGFGAFSYATDL